MTEYHPTKAPKEESLPGKRALSDILKPPKPDDWEDALLHISLEASDGLAINANDRYHTLWDLFLADKTWYARHGTSLMHMFKSFLVCTTQRDIHLNGGTQEAEKLNALLDTRYLVIPIVKMEIVAGKLMSLTLQGLNSKQRSVRRSGVNMRTRNLMVVDACLNKQWVQFQHGATQLWRMYPGYGERISPPQMRAMGEAFYSDGVQIEKIIEAAFGESIGVFNEDN